MNEDLMHEFHKELVALQIKYSKKITIYENIQTVFMTYIYSMLKQFPEEEMRYIFNTYLDACVEAVKKQKEKQ